MLFGLELKEKLGVRKLEMELKQASIREKRLYDDLSIMKVNLQKQEEELKWLKTKVHD